MEERQRTAVDLGHAQSSAPSKRTSPLCRVTRSRRFGDASVVAETRGVPRRLQSVRRHAASPPIQSRSRRCAESMPKRPADSIPSLCLPSSACAYVPAPSPPLRASEPPRSAPHAGSISARAHRRHFLPRLRSRGAFVKLASMAAASATDLLYFNCGC